MNSMIDLIKLKEYRDKLFKDEMIDGIKERQKWTKEEEELGDRVFDHIFGMGMFAGVNMILHNPDFQIKGEKQQ